MFTPRGECPTAHGPDPTLGTVAWPAPRWTGVRPELGGPAHEAQERVCPTGTPHRCVTGRDLAKGKAGQ